MVYCIMYDMILVESSTQVWRIERLFGKARVDLSFGVVFDLSVLHKLPLETHFVVSKQSYILTQQFKKWKS